MQEIKIQDTATAWDWYEAVKKALVDQARLFLIIGKALKEIRDQKLYKQLGQGGFDTFGEFLRNPEISRLAPSTLMMYIRVYEYYVEKLQIEQGKVLEIGTNRLQRMLPKLKTKEDAEAKKIIEDVAYLGHDDYKTAMKENGITYSKPSLYQDKETGKWIFDFDEDQVFRIFNRDSNKVIFGEQFEVR